MRNHYQDRFHRLRLAKNLSSVGLLYGILFLAASAHAEDAKLIVPIDGSSTFKKTVSEQIVIRLNKRVRTSKTSGVDVSRNGVSSLAVRSDKPLTMLNRTLLTSAGRFEIREIEAKSPLFEIAKSEFKNVFTRQDGGVWSLCSERRADLSNVMARMVGPDMNFATYHYPDVGWCALALGKKSLHNDAVESVRYQKSMEGSEALSVRIDPKKAQQFAENGLVSVKVMAVTLDGDLIARSTLSQIRRLPVAIQVPDRVKAKKQKTRWLRVVHALIETRLPTHLILSK